MPCLWGGGGGGGEEIGPDPICIYGLRVTSSVRLVILASICLYTFFLISRM